ncbi:MAG: 60S ribosomal export protein NMD3, partial [Nanoarchaeota archaeon]|nr:60S ribosomal export protein NMD3 [Nanoarchaeota archaeon]
CEECSQKELELEFKDIVVSICVHCGKFLCSNVWKPAADIEAAVISIAKQKIKNPKRIEYTLEPLVAGIEPKPGVKKDIEIKVIIGADEFAIPAKIEFTYCTKCGKLGTQYYEGVLQIRDVDKQLIDLVERRIAKAADDGIFLAKKEKSGTGFDYYLTDKRFIRKLGQELKRQFKGELKESAQLFSRDHQTSKNIYRLNVFFRQSKKESGE